MFKFIKECGITIFFILGLFSSGFCEESITITTYYPSPYGSYNDLYVANNVGIGTASPSANLHIKPSGASELRIDTGAVDVNTRLSFYENGVDKWIMDNVGASSDIFRIMSNSVSNILLLTQIGNVGIGTNNPQAKLEVGGSIKASGGSSGKATCWNGTQIGYCSSAVAVDGSCTCN